MISRQQLRNYPACAVFDGATTKITSGSNTGIVGSSALSMSLRGKCNAKWQLSICGTGRIH